MLKKTKNLIFIVASSLMLMLSFAPRGVTALDCSNPLTTQEQVQCGACNGSGIDPATCATGAANSAKTADATIKKIINILSIAGGIIAVIMIIVAGIRYTTSGGSEQGTASAKKSLLYAIIGLVIVALAQVIAKFALNQATR